MYLYIYIYIFQGLLPKTPIDLKTLEFIVLISGCLLWVYSCLYFLYICIYVVILLGYIVSYQREEGR